MLFWRSQRLARWFPEAIRFLLQKDLSGLADAVGVVLGFDHGNRNTRFPRQHVVRELPLLLVTRRKIPAHDDRAWRKPDFAANLPHGFPASIPDCRRDEQIADVDFAELFLVVAVH